ncbi:uncharacterized protein LOC144008050 isoform X1 [Festucalex cinctus]
MAPPVQMVQSIRHDQLVSNMNANCTFQSKWGLSEFLQSRRLLADEAAGCSKVKESSLIDWSRRPQLAREGFISAFNSHLNFCQVEDDGRFTYSVKVGQACAQLQIFSLILHPQGSKKHDELPENAAVWKPFQKTTCLSPSSCSWLTS